MSCPGCTSNRLDQDLWVWPLGISIFETFPSDSKLGLKLRPGAWNWDMHALTFRTHPFLPAPLWNLPPLEGAPCLGAGGAATTESGEVVEKQQLLISQQTETQACPFLVPWSQGCAPAPRPLAKSSLTPPPVFLVQSRRLSFIDSEVREQQSLCDEGFA